MFYNARIEKGYINQSYNFMKSITFLSHHTVVWLGYLVYYLFVYLYSYGFLSVGKR